MAQFTRQLKDLSVPDGEVAIFEVRFEPKNFKVIWFREDTEILDNNDFRIFCKNGVSTLVIGQAYLEDAGAYHAQLYDGDNPTNQMSTGSLNIQNGKAGVTTGEKCPSSLYKAGPAGGFVGALALGTQNPKAYSNPSARGYGDRAGPVSSMQTMTKPPSTGPTVKFNPRVEVSVPTYIDDMVSPVPEMDSPKRTPQTFSPVQPPVSKKGALTDGGPPVVPSRPFKPGGMVPPGGAGPSLLGKPKLQMTKISAISGKGSSQQGMPTSESKPEVVVTQPPQNETQPKKPEIKLSPPPQPKSIIKPVVHEPFQQSKQIEVQSTNRNASSPEPIDLDDNESSQVNQIQAHLGHIRLNIPGLREVARFRARGFPTLACRLWTQLNPSKRCPGPPRGG